MPDTNTDITNKTGLFTGKGLYIILLLIALPVVFILSMGLGSVAIPARDIINILLGYGSEHAAWEKIIYQIRLPKALAAILAGSALAVGGIQMQTLFRNPLAGPSVLGISSGASLGVAFIMLAINKGSIGYLDNLGIGGSWLIIIAAILGASLVMLTILLISFRIRDNVVLLIVGIMIGYLTISIVSIWQYFSEPEQIQSYLLWTFGSLGGITNAQIPVFAGTILAGIVLSFALSKWLNVMLLGENYARTLGVNMKLTRILIIIATSILTGAVTGFCGPISFIGIAVPHLARSLFNTSDHRILIPTVAVSGAILLLLCDIAAQYPGSQTTFPLNAITSLIGAPIVIWIIVKRKNLGKAF